MENGESADSPFFYYIAIINNIPAVAIIIAPNVNGQKYFFTIVFACSWNRHSKYPTIAKRPVRNTADRPRNKNAGNPIKPAQIAINLYGIGVTAVKNIINMPCLINRLCANSNFSMLAKCSIIHTPTESKTNNPIQYAIIPPTIDPNVAAKTTGTARFLFAIIGGVIKTSGGINKKIDSHTVRKNTSHVYVLLSARANRYSDNFMILFRVVKNFS